MTGARAQERPPGGPLRPPRALRKDAVRNYERILDSAREIFGQSGSDACMEQIAAHAHVGVGTVYRRFASKHALMDELLRLALDDLIEAATRALARTDGHGLEHLLRAFGCSFAEHASYANLLLEREPDPAATAAIRAATAELTARAVTAGTVGPGVTTSDVTALLAGLRGLVQAPGVLRPDSWQRFLDIHMDGLRATQAKREAARPAGEWRPE